MLTVVRVDRAEERVAAVRLVLRPARGEQAFAVVLQAEPDRAVTRRLRVVRHQGVEAALVPTPPIVVGEVLTGRGVLGVGAAVVADEQGDATPALVRDVERVVLVRVRRRLTGLRVARRAGREAVGQDQAGRAGEVRTDHDERRRRLGHGVGVSRPHLFETKRQPRRRTVAVLPGRVRLDPFVVPSLDARCVQQQLFTTGERRLRCGVLRDRQVVAELRPRLTEVRGLVHTVQDGVVGQPEVARACLKLVRYIEHRHTAVEQARVLHDRVEIVVVLLGAGGLAELGPADPRGRGEPARSKLRERPGRAGRGPVQPVAGRLDLPVGEGLRGARAVTDRGKDLAARGIRRTSRCLDHDVGDPVGELAPAVSGRARAVGRPRLRWEIHVGVGAARIGGAVEAHRGRDIDRARMRWVRRDLVAHDPVRHTGRVVPGVAEVVGPERAEPGTRVTAVDRLTADGHDGAADTRVDAACRHPADRADDLRREGVTDRRPVLGEVGRHPDATGADRREQPVVRRVVVEAVDAAGEVGEPFAVDRGVGRAIGDERGLAERSPVTAGAWDLRRRGEHRGPLLRGLPVRTRRDGRVRRGRGVGAL